MDFDVKSTCRTCLQKADNGILITECVDNNDLNLCEMLTMCTGLTNSNVIEFPNKMCSSCAVELPSVWKFVNMCKSSDVVLQNYYFERKYGTHLNKVESFKVEVDIKEEIDTPSVKSDFSNEDFEPLVNFKTEDDELRNLGDGPILHKSRRNSSKKGTKGRKKPHRSYKGVFKCSLCDYVLDTECRLRKHVKAEHPEQLEQIAYPCRDCEKKFMRKSDLRVHQRIHSGEKPFACAHCPQRFAQSGTLIEHNRCHTGETPFSCKICARVFSSRSSFWRHRRVHSGERPYACDKCDRSFAHGATLKHHRLVHSEDRPHSCELCGKCSKSKYALQQHMLTHSEKDFICHQCGKKFSMKYNLENHIKKMHSDKAGQCCICRKVTSNLNEHMIIHTGENPFRCHLCTRTFRQKNSLSFHITLHKNAEKYKCQAEGCRKAFPKQNMLDFHTRKIHSNETPHICPHCSKGFFRTSDLSRHINTLH